LIEFDFLGNNSDSTWPREEEVTWFLIYDVLYFVHILLMPEI
jgi:hypothetical protein